MQTIKTVAWVLLGIAVAVVAGATLAAGGWAAGLKLDELFHQPLGNDGTDSWIFPPIGWLTWLMTALGLTVGAVLGAVFVRRLSRRFDAATH